MRWARLVALEFALKPREADANVGGSLESFSYRTGSHMATRIGATQPSLQSEQGSPASPQEGVKRPIPSWLEKARDSVRRGVLRCGECSAATPIRAGPGAVLCRAMSLYGRGHSTPRQARGARSQGRIRIYPVVEW
eukprot:5100210-Pleurochrysis_carterae.AAC.2